MFLCFADGDRHGNRQTTLPGAAKRAVADDLCCEFHVRIRQNDYMILCSALALHALAASGGAGVHMFCHGSRANEADGAHLRMIAKRVNHVASAIDEVDDTLGQASLL